ncbi:DUF4286 family protein [Chitinophagaceae bacterium LB-8]|uniref:DUF4286 family protein n=1 Tax=Paraflavisolibacter caeni TaxID=2982496 RepID=A0A9X3B655_9BACT|nr:DUF4286 family protein [Paraflavisolibacter caeni]MCU7547520.1 DUF4286 family protein [Paraflavisolibacter caeni]
MMNEQKKEGPGLIYNVTMKVEPSIAASWLQWMLEEHIPEIMSTNCFLDYRVVKILEADESEGPTYAFQYHAASKEKYQTFIDRFANILRDKSYAKWGDRFIAFRTIMEVVK